MEIKLSAGDKLNIPANCKATIEGDLIVIKRKKKEKKEEFKDDNVSFRSYNSHAGILKWIVYYFRHATEEEKQALSDDLKANGLKWNDETKEMEKIRKRAERYAYFLHINGFGEVIRTKDWGEGSIDDNLYNLGNYYLPEELEQAEEDAKAIKAFFEKRLKVKL